MGSGRGEVSEWRENTHFTQMLRLPAAEAILVTEPYYLGPLKYYLTTKYLLTTLIYLIQIIGGYCSQPPNQYYFSSTTIPFSNFKKLCCATASVDGDEFLDGVEIRDFEFF